MVGGVLGSLLVEEDDGEDGEEVGECGGGEGLVEEGDNGGDQVDVVSPSNELLLQHHRLFKCLHHFIEPPILYKIERSYQPQHRIHISFETLPSKFIHVAVYLVGSDAVQLTLQGFGLLLGLV